MTEPFDFKKAGAAARRDYPKETEKIDFILSDDEDAAEKMDALIYQMDPALRDWLYDGMSAEDIAQRQRDFIAEGGAFSCRDPLTGRGFIYLDLEKTAGKLSPRLSRDKALHYAFNHELAHIVVPGALPSCFIDELRDMDRPGLATALRLYVARCENKADALGAMRTAAQGNLTTGDIRRIALSRAFNVAAGGDTEHMTVITLDRVASMTAARRMSGIAPADMAALASDIGLRHAPSLSDTLEASKLHLSAAGLAMAGFNDNASVALAVCNAMADPNDGLSPQGDYGRYLTARLAVPLLTKNTDGTFDAIDKHLGHGTVEKARDALAAQASLATSTPFAGKLLQRRLRRA